MSALSQLAFVLFAAVLAGPAFAAPAPSKGSPREQLKAVVAQIQQAPSDAALREKAIELARRLKPSPAEPEDLERFMARGAAAMKAAKTPAEFRDAAAEFEKASLAAPWNADAYYNLGVARGKAEDFGGAAAALKLYLLAAPKAPDAKAAKALMYEMEFSQEKAAKDRASAAVLNLLRGTWHAQVCDGDNDESYRGCTDAERGMSRWRKMRGDHGPLSFSFEFPADGVVNFPVGMAGWMGCTYAVQGVAAGPSPSDMRWEERSEGGTPRSIYFTAAADGSWWTMSCSRPISGADPAQRYSYVNWVRP